MDIKKHRFYFNVHYCHLTFINIFDISKIHTVTYSCYAYMHTLTLKIEVRHRNFMIISTRKYSPPSRAQRYRDQPQRLL